MSRGIRFEIRDSDAVALTSSGALKLDRHEFTLLTRIATANSVHERIGLIASITDCAVCAHPSADRLHDLLAAGRSRAEIEERLGQVPSSAEMERHLRDDHPRPPAGGIGPTGWLARLPQQLAERGVILNRPGTWTCRVCRSPYRDAVEQGLRRWTPILAIGSRYGFSNSELVAHKQHLRR